MRKKIPFIAKPKSKGVYFGDWNRGYNDERELLAIFH